MNVFTPFWMVSVTWGVSTNAFAGTAKVLIRFCCPCDKPLHFKEIFLNIDVGIALGKRGGGY